MRVFAMVAVVGVGCQGHAPPPAPEPTPPRAVATAAAPHPATAPSSSSEYACQPLGSSKVSIHFRERYSVEDVANWLVAWSCRTVVVSRHLHDRRSTGGYNKLFEARELPIALGELLEPLNIRAITQGAVTVFVSADDKLGDGKPGLVWDPEPPRSRAIEGAELAAGITRVDDLSYRVKRSTIDRILADPIAASRGVRVVPSIKNGKPNGFKLYAIRPASVYALLGFQNGDTIHRINGHDISTPDKALEVYTRLRDATAIELDLSRRGKPVKLRFAIE
jgi:hypothetical protein